MTSAEVAKMNWGQVKEASIEVAVLPWGATEPHNYHLPYGTDSLIAEYLAVKAVEKSNSGRRRVVVLPTVPFGVNTAQVDVKLTINLNHSTQLMVLKDIVQSLEHQGIKKLVIVNGHGANSFVPMIREIFAQSEVFICLVNTYQCVDNRKFFQEPGDHAGEMETSLIMNMHPELVAPMSSAGTGAYKKFKIRGLTENWAWAQREWTKITSDNGVGNPHNASLEKGKACIEEMVTKLAGLFQEIADADLNDLYQ